MARKILPKIKKILFIFSSFTLIILSYSCSRLDTKTSVRIPTKNPLVEKYKIMRMRGWKTYANEPKKIQSKNNPIPSMNKMVNNPIFEQVTQIHCFKIRASTTRCNALKYLAMVNCGEIINESDIKRYSKCLEENFKN